MEPSPRLEPEHWVARHGDALYRFAMLRLGRSDLAAEVVQETFLEALRCRDRFSGKSSERTWLIGILKHKVVDSIRRSARESSLDHADPVEEFGPEDPSRVFNRRGHWSLGPKHWKGDPSRSLEAREFWHVFRQCVSNMPEHLAEPFLLRELEGLEGEEICQILEITPTNLWARIHRARLMLRECLERRWFRRDDRRR